MKKSDVMELFSSERELATALGVSHTLVQSWKDTIPMARRECVRKAMRVKADKLDKEAAKLRAASVEVGE